MTQMRTDAEIWDSISLDLISILVDGKFVYVNSAGARMLGAATSGQLIGKLILDFVHPHYREITAERIQLAMIEGIVLCPDKEIWLRLDGTAIDVEVVAMPYFYKGRRTVQLIACVDDECKSYRPAGNRHSAFTLRRKHR